MCPDPNRFHESESKDVVAWKLARAAIEHENHLVNHRMTWFYTAQGFLLSAAGLVLSVDDTKQSLLADDRMQLVVVVALYTFALLQALCTIDGLNRAWIATARATKRYYLFIGKRIAANIPPLHLWAEPLLLNQRSLPFASIIFWTFLLGIVFFFM